jgi:uncharacterized membrane protein
MWLQPDVHRLIIAGLFFLTGILHFGKPQVFIKIMPDYIPFHAAMVYISGVAEIAGAAGILIDSTQHVAGWGLIALLFAVFPANINMAREAVYKFGWLHWYSVGTIVRLPLQFVLIYWIYWACLG